MLGEVDWRTQIELLKIQNKMHSTLVQKEESQEGHRAGPGYHIDHAIV